RVERRLESLDRLILAIALDGGELLAFHFVQLSPGEPFRTLERRAALVHVRVVALKIGIAPRRARRRIGFRGCFRCGRLRGSRWSLCECGSTGERENDSQRETTMDHERLLAKHYMDWGADCA